MFYVFAAVAPSTGVFYRAFFGLPLLALVALGERRRHGPLPRESIWLAALAGAFFTGDLMFWHHAIEAVGAGLATVLGNLQVLIVGVAAWLFLGERPSRSTLAALPVVLIGVVLISGVVGQDAYGSNPQLGVILGIATALCYSGYLLIIRRSGRDERRPAGPVAIATLSVIVCSFVVGELVARRTGLLGVRDRGEQHPQGAGADLVAGLHRGGQIGTQACLESAHATHCGSLDG